MPLAQCGVGQAQSNGLSHAPKAVLLSVSYRLLSGTSNAPLHGLRHRAQVKEPARLRLFLSHISSETELASYLKRAIEQAFLGGVHVFVSSDPFDIPAGKQWVDGLVQELRRCHI